MERLAANRAAVLLHTRRSLAGLPLGGAGIIPQFRKGSEQQRYNTHMKKLLSLQDMLREKSQDQQLSIAFAVSTPIDAR